MAKIYPATINPDTQSNAERTLFAAFRDQLPSDYHVFHSVAWQARNAQSGARDGEADFVIAHSQHGILILEVKGGRIHYDGTTGRWTAKEIYAIKDPFEQAKGSKHHLRKTLKEETYWQDRYFTMAHAVAFPDVAMNWSRLTLQAPKEIVLDQRHVLDVTSWVEGVFSYYKGADNSPNEIGVYGISYLVDMLAPVRELRPMLSVDMVGEAAKIVKLTEQQYQLLDFIAHQPRAGISGCAGSGKTMLAAEKARRLAKQGWRVLLTCYNKNLAEYLRDDYLSDAPPNLHIENFHKLATTLVQKSGQRLPRNTQTEQYFRTELPDMLANVRDHMGDQYDAIIVDEAQDFHEGWYLALQYLLPDPDESTFYIFYDDNQNIYGGLSKVKNLVTSYPLTRNCRNTQHIHQVATRFYQSDTKLDVMGPEGRAVVVTTYHNDQTLKHSLSKMLHNLVNEEGVDPSDIVILTPRGRSKSKLTRFFQVGSFSLTSSWADPDPRRILYTTIYSFKGLESPIIILTELDGITQNNLNELLYVGISRARHHLIVLCDEENARHFQ